MLPLPAPPTGIIASQWVERARDFSGGSGPMASVDEDLARILGLPVLDLEEPRCPNREGYARSLYSHIAPPDFKLRDIQIDSVYTYEAYGGMFGPQGVGIGKTLTSLLIGKVAIQRRGHQRTLILVPPEVFSQLTLRDLPQARKWLALDGVPYWIVSGTAAQRMRVVEQPGPGVFIYSYSSLSTKTGMEELARIAPTQVTLDEAQNVANSGAARTRRLLTALAQVEQALKAGRLGPDVRVREVEMVALSGTMTKRSVKDYLRHLAKRCLKTRSPAPIKDLAIMSLSQAIDANVSGAGQTELDMARIDQIKSWAREQGWDYTKGRTKDEVANMSSQDLVREAYQYRLRTAPGVVATSVANVDASLIIAWSEPPRPRTDEGEALCKYMKMAAIDMKTPDGDAIDFGMHTFKWMWELTAGFYNSLIWPGLEDLQEEGARARACRSLSTRPPPCSRVRSASTRCSRTITSSCAFTWMGGTSPAAILRCWSGRSSLGSWPPRRSSTSSRRSSSRPTALRRRRRSMTCRSARAGRFASATTRSARRWSGRVRIRTRAA